MTSGEPEPHPYCSVECPCGHWNDHRRCATKRADGRRGKPNLDVVESNYEPDEVSDDATR